MYHAWRKKKKVSGNLYETDELEDQNIVDRIIIKHIFERKGQRCYGCWAETCFQFISGHINLLFCYMTTMAVTHIIQNWTIEEAVNDELGMKRKEDNLA